MSLAVRETQHKRPPQETASYGSLGYARQHLSAWPDIHHTGYIRGELLIESASAVEPMVRKVGLVVLPPTIGVNHQVPGHDFVVADLIGM